MAFRNWEYSLVDRYASQVDFVTWAFGYVGISLVERGWGLVIDFMDPSLEGPVGVLGRVVLGWDRILRFFLIFIF
jgi:hypothetical protein